MRGLTAFAVALGVATFASQADAQRPVALVEDVSAGVQGVELLDYVTQGQEIRLGSGQSITLSYLGSCRRETISGGTVRIGAQSSEVAGGSVETEQMQCDRQALRLAAAQAGQSGATAIRVQPPAIPGVLPNPELTIRSVSPLLKVNAPGAVTFERLDRQSQPITVQVSGRVLDLGTAGTRLEAGGLYRVKQGDKALVVKVADNARTTPGPIGDRLIPM
jgi:hypothetical protein